MLSLVICLLLVGVLGLAVLASMALENWGRWSVDLPSVDLPVAGSGADPVGCSSVEPAPAQREPDEALLDEVLHNEVVPDEALTDEPELVVPGRATADRTAAVLFAAYAAQRRPEADRAAAWVTASDWPPSRTGGSYRPGADLRGKPVAVGRLLDCADQGRCWVTLSEATDIARGIRSRPPTCEVLRGVLVVWQSTRAALTRVDGEQAAMALRAVEELEPRWATTTGAPDVTPVVEVLRRAVSAGTGLVVRVTLEPAGADPTGSAAQTSSAVPAGRGPTEVPVAG